MRQELMTSRMCEFTEQPNARDFQRVADTFLSQKPSLRGTKKAYEEGKERKERNENRFVFCVALFYTRFVLVFVWVHNFH